MLRLLTLVLLIGLSLRGGAQVPSPFWSETTATPVASTGLGNLSIAQDPTTDDIWVGTVEEGIFRSHDRGMTWEAVLPLEDLPVSFLAITPQGTVYALVGANALYRSDNGGESWSSTPLETTFSVTDLLVVGEDTLFAATGDLVEGPNDSGLFRGAGIFRSVDRGATWQALDLGLGSGRYVAHLARDRQGRLFAAVNEYHARDGRLLYSTDEGTSWYPMPTPRFETGGSAPNESSIVQIFALDVAPDDSLYLSYGGAFGSASTQVTLVHSFEGAVAALPWQHKQVVPIGYAWDYPEIHNLLFVPDRGHVYVNRRTMATPTNGSIFVSDDGQAPWQSVPLYPVGPRYHQCQFARQHDGRIFVVQEGDHRVYFTDHSQRTPTSAPQDEFAWAVSVFPNPADDFISVHVSDAAPVRLLLQDLTGRTVGQTERQPSGGHVTFPVAGLPRGVYLLSVTQRQRHFHTRVVLTSSH
ncbi:Por secretion system C-terminal sorting domain-containing protein [Catalinimonas alkaloidigena]|uniref:Por secretion system C-terminal sorting domain-containing protein n=1 Tax=Catalinimonas alkaloidigena TaxID=1075417 RepID=A0A1G9UGF5_9BACT|nr:T9SS type A sorting domain-containing protein [Catalinimonas alkaloidigena]SDM58844.1 Por secretion system C-terminal sorting domain-containing protein [Catalinimonas alkaloidigena]